MRLFTVRPKSDPGRGCTVFAVRADGALLISDEADELHWVPAEECLAGTLYRDPLEQAWWDRMSGQAGHEHGSEG